VMMAVRPCMGAESPALAAFFTFSAASWIVLDDVFCWTRSAAPSTTSDALACTRQDRRTVLSSN
jgi:hypothetical protein